MLLCPQLFQETRLCFVSKWEPVLVWRWVSRDVGNSLVTWRIRCRTHFIHTALSALWAEEIRIHCAVVSTVLVSLLFCWVAWCAGFYSNILVKKKWTLHTASPQLIPTVKFNVKSGEQENWDGKALYWVAAEVSLCVRCTCNTASEDCLSEKPHPVNWGWNFRSNSQNLIT